MNRPPQQGRGGMTGGAVLVLVTSALLVTVLLLVIGGNDPAAPTPSAQTGSSPSAVPAPLPSPDDWFPLPSTPDPSAEMATPTPGEYVQATSVGQPGSTPNPGRSPVGAYAFSAIAGSGCAQTESSGAYAAYPAGQQVSAQAGGWRGPGCAGGSFWSVPTSGNTGQSTDGLYVLWWFHTEVLSSGRCTIWVYVPKSGADGQPTHYEVARGRDDQGVIGQFTVDQPASRGAWAQGGTFALNGGNIALKLVNRGAGSARHGAAQVQVGCRPEAG